MCGRYGESKILAQVKGKVPFFRAESAPKPHYNIALTQMAPVIVSQGESVLKDMRWGLIPFWAKDEEIGSRMINARAENSEGEAVVPKFIEAEAMSGAGGLLLRMAEDSRQNA
jgi:putative SOS response-associated peptidase YedK